MYIPTKNRKKLLIVSAISGTGHEVTARALESLLSRRHYVDVVPVHRIFGTFNYIGELFYNFCLTRGWIRLIEPYHRLSRMLIRLYRPILFITAKRFFNCRRFDCIVSCIPWVNHYFIRLLPDVPLVTVITDHCHSDTHAWIQHNKQRLICPSEKSVEQARGLGVPEHNIFPVSGNIISPIFYDGKNNTPNSREGLAKLGLDPGRKTALLFYGGFGPDFMADLARSIEGWNVIIVWGRNPKRINKTGCVNLGYTDEIPFYMRLADLLVGKPGPGVVSEAVHCNLPVLVDARKGSLLPQEKDVLDWIRDEGFGTSFSSLGNFKRKMSSIGEVELARWCRNAEKIENNALYEAVEAIESIVDGI